MPVTEASAATSSQTITVPATQPWTDTGISLPAGPISFNASGTINVSSGDPAFDETPAGDGPADPTCVAGPSSWSGSWTADGLPCWSLIGRIGNGAPFEIGDSATYTVSSPGELYLGVDDETGQFGDNSGSWTVQASWTPATGPYNSAINNLTTDATTDQSETTIAVSSANSPGLTVMVAYNDFRANETTGYSYSFDGGTRWTDGITPPVYKDPTTGAFGSNGGDPALTVDSNGTFYLAQIEYTANISEFIGLSSCKYDSTSGKLKCARPRIVSSVDNAVCGGHLHVLNDKPGITYDPTNNRVYVTWTHFTYDTQCNITQSAEYLRYFSPGSPSVKYKLGSVTGNGTAPVVTNSGLVYVFFLKEASSGAGQAIKYFTFNNGTIASHTLDNLYPAASIDSNCGTKQEAFTTQAFANGHDTRTNEFPAAAVDNSGNIDVVWEAATSLNGTVPSIFVATIPSNGGTTTIQYLPNPANLIQWQPAVAVTGGNNTLAVTYFQVVNTPAGYQIERDQVTAPASAVPAFGPPQMISTNSWDALPYQSSSNNDNACYEGDYSASASTPTANVVWSYWGTNRNGSQADVYGLYTNVP